MADKIKDAINSNGSSELYPLTPKIEASVYKFQSQPVSGTLMQSPKKVQSGELINLKNLRVPEG